MLKRYSRLTIPTLVLLFGCTTALTQPTWAEEQALRAPAGFTVEVLLDGLDNARQMALTNEGTLIVGTRRKGHVYAVTNALTETPGPVVTLMRDLLMPSGVAIKDGALYIGATDRVLRIDDIDNNVRANPEFTTITDVLPDERHHGWKYLKFGPDGALYVPVGAPCNICLSEDERFATLLRMDPSSGKTQVWAAGVRNTVGFDWHPEYGDLWFSDNGRDHLGDDLPPEEINRIGRPGQHFGYPFMHGDDIKDPEFGDHAAAKGLTFTPPEVKIQAHSAALGMDFYTGQTFPSKYANALFIAEHGSWNRSAKVGYRVSVVTEGAYGNLNYEPFIEGWLVGEEAWGRPNDVLVTPEGDLLISDDQQGLIYRVSYSAQGGS